MEIYQFSSASVSKLTALVLETLGRSRLICKWQFDFFWYLLSVQERSMILSDFFLGTAMHHLMWVRYFIELSIPNSSMAVFISIFMGIIVLFSSHYVQSRCAGIIE